MLSRALRHRFALRVTVALLLLALLAYGLLAPSRQPGLAPPLPGAALRGPAVSVAALRGRPAVIAFFASWCGPCRLEAPALERFATSPIGRGQMIAVDYGDVPARARAFIARYHWSFPVLSDPSTAFGDAYGVAHLPTTVILDANGRIVARDYGAQTIASLDRAFRAARSLS